MINLPWILAHFIGDYIVQNDWMAKGKKVNSWICIIHVIMYMLPFLFTQLTFIQFILIGLQHYAQDRSNFIKWFCKITGNFQNEGPYLPWGHFIVDNIFHITFIWIMVNYIKLSS
jgi:hypothetical protein